MLRENFPRLSIKEVRDEDALSRGLAITYFSHMYQVHVNIVSDNYITLYNKIGPKITIASKIKREKINSPITGPSFEYTFDKSRDKKGIQNPWTNIFLGKYLRGYYMPPDIRDEMEFIGYYHTYKQIATFDGFNYMVPDFRLLSLKQLTEDKEFRAIYEKTIGPILLVKLPKSDTKNDLDDFETLFKDEPRVINLRDINISYTDKNNEYRTFGTYKYVIEKIPTLKPFVNEKNIELPKGKCSDAIIRVILDVDGYTKINYDTLNVEECLEILCGLRYLQADTKKVELKLEQNLEEEDDLFRVLYPHREMIEYLRNQGMKLILHIN